MARQIFCWNITTSSKFYDRARVRWRALELYAKVNRLGIVPAAGHSSAKDDQVLAAMKVGMRHITHIWSAQSTTIREGPWRKPGLLEASLTFDGLTVEMISDNKHLPPP